MVMTTVYLVVENLDGLGDDAAGNDSVGGGNGRDDVARHGLHLEPGFLSNVEDEHPDVGAGRHKVQGQGVVLVPLQGLFGSQLVLHTQVQKLSKTVHPSFMQNNGRDCGSERTRTVTF